MPSLTTHHPLHSTVPSPIGPLTLVARDGRLTGLYLQDQRHRPVDPPAADRDVAVFAETAAQLAAYFAGGLTVFDLPLEPEGSAWQRRVWAALRDIPYGQTRSYGQVAAAVGSPGAARAVGLANGRNPLCLVVPCHRVIGASGALTGYGGGMERKRWLLEHERGAPAQLTLG